LFKKVLIANRAEVAVRVIRACRELGIETAAVYSEADRESLHLKLADEVYPIGPPQPSQSYLNIERIIEVAKKSASEAIHPGYGFLAQIPAFVQACEENNIAFIGPPSQVLEKMSNKVSARRAVEEAGLHVIPGTLNAVNTVDETEKVAERLGYPVFMKAVYGGGGRGMRLIKNAGDISEAFELTRLEAETSFGNSEIYLEKQLIDPRHIEFQILADKRGNVVHLGERECSIQRKNQKLVEETPSPMVTIEQREAIGEQVVRAAKAINYVNAGTVEFLVDKEGSFHFLEMNTRLQVEHLITEMVTGVDIVKAQIHIAADDPLEFGQEDITIHGHTINCRINAEDPYNDFAPCPDTVTNYRAPGGPYVRVDSALYAGYTIPAFYDSLIAKLAVWGRNRIEAIHRMQSALAEIVIEGIETTIPLHKRILEDKSFVEGRIHTGFLRRRAKNKLSRGELRNTDIAALIAALAFLSQKNSSPSVAIPKRRTSTTSRWKTLNRSVTCGDFKWGE
jgi:acetyl-CoA carboxylase biotin carboxylase subunit